MKLYRVTFRSRLGDDWLVTKVRAASKSAARAALKNMGSNWKFNSVDIIG